MLDTLIMRPDRCLKAICFATALQNPNAPSVVTYRELQRNPETSGDDAEVLVPNIGQAQGRSQVESVSSLYR